MNPRLNHSEAGLDPSKGNALLLTTNTEVSIAPKLHRSREALSNKPPINGHAAVGAKPTINGSAAAALPTPTTKAASEILRVIPSRLVSGSTYPDHSRLELLAFVSPRTLDQLEPLLANRTISWFHHAAFKKLAAPHDPSVASNDAPTPEPTTRVLNAAVREDPVTAKSIPGDIYIGVSKDIPTGHIVFSALPDGLEEWDLVRWGFPFV